MRIVHISSGGPPVLYRYGGAIQRQIVEIAEQQVTRGNEVVVYSPGEADQRTEHNGIEIRYLRCPKKPQVGGLVLQARAIADLRREHLDVLNFYSQPEGALVGRRIRAVKLLSYNYFVFRRGRATPLYWLYRRLLGSFDALLPISEYCLEQSRAYWGLDPARLHIVYSGVNLDQFRPDSDLGRAEREGLGIEGRVLLYVGRVCEQKGTDLLLAAYERLRRDRDDVRLVIAGPIGQFGGNRHDGGWPQRIRETGGIYLGAVAEERLAAVYNMADLFVMPTRYVEMFGMAAVEAQACGKPVVASDHGGLREVVPLDCGSRFVNGDERDLAAKIGFLLDDRQAYLRASSRARENAACFGWSKVVDRLDKIYSSFQKTGPRS